MMANIYWDTNPGIAKVKRRSDDTMNGNDTLCNMCGQSCTLEPGPLGGGPCGLIDAEVRGYYNSTPGNGSGALDDGDTYKFSLCEFCLDWLFNTFVIPVEVKDGVQDLPESPPIKWKPAMQRVSEDKWRKQKERFYEAFRLHEGNRRVYLNNKYDVLGRSITDWTEYRRTHDLDGNQIDADGNIIKDNE